MMKKEEMIKELIENGYEQCEDLTWTELQKFYKEKKEFFNIPIKHPDEKDVEEKLERKLEKEPDTRTPLEKKREELYPKIIDIMRRLKGRNNATHEELREMFNLYNQFYLRNDSPTCGACVGRVWTTFSKITKGYI